jgi:hypothetical protein
LKRLHQSGIFKASPQSWDVRTAQSGAVAINMGFLIAFELENDDWASWADFDQHMTYGDWWIIKKDGTINQQAVDQLVECLGWNGDLNSIVGPPPASLVQISVKEEMYKGEPQYKAAWMNPENYEGGGGFGGANASETQALVNRFGSLLKAAAASSKAGAPKEPASKASGPKASGPKGPAAQEPPQLKCAECGEMRSRDEILDSPNGALRCMKCDDIPF